MSYSVFIDKDLCNNSELLSHTIPRRVYKWIPDEDVTNCHGCKKMFGWFFRKHHCRFCGKIFCDYCLVKNVSIPEELLSEDSKKGSTKQYLTSYVYKNDPTKHMVCYPCNDLIKFIDSVTKLIDVFRLLKFDVKILKLFGSVCKPWRNASNYILSIFREIQYKLPTEDYTAFERELLVININNIVGHNKYIVHLINSCKTKDDYALCLPILSKPKNTNCKIMMCSRNCCDKIMPFDVINILCKSFNCVGFNDILRYVILEYLDCDNDEFLCYLPLLVFNIKNDSNVISNFLIERCKDDIVLLNALYWELNLYSRNKTNCYSIVFEILKKLLSGEKYANSFKKIMDGSTLVRTLHNISNNIYNDNKKYDDIKDMYLLKKPLLNPLTYDDICDINIEKIQTKVSASKPLLIPCETVNGDIVKILYKNEEVRKDQIIINIFKLADIILKREEGLDLGIITYNILPVGESCGLINIVGNCDTIYTIQEELKMTILNYILENNEDLKVRDIRERFTKSTAAFCVLTYLFGIGDRHLDNIMVTKDGKLFHIDFGYILGNDPVMTNPGIRITQSMIETMGGDSSANYKYFKKLCNIIYNCLRRNIDIFINMLLVLPKISDINLNEQKILDEIIKRFIPGENQVDAEIHFDTQLEKQNYMDNIKDWCHYHSKEKTITNTMNKMSYVMTNLISVVMPDKKSF